MMGLVFRTRPELMLLAAGATAGIAARSAEKHRMPVAGPRYAGPSSPAAGPEIERLSALHASGALTDAELSAASSRLLGTGADG